MSRRQSTAPPSCSTLSAVTRLWKVPHWFCRHTVIDGPSISSVTQPSRNAAASSASVIMVRRASSSVANMWTSGNSMLSEYSRTQYQIVVAGLGAVPRRRAIASSMALVALSLSDWLMSSPLAIDPRQQRGFVPDHDTGRQLDRLRKPRVFLHPAPHRVGRDTQQRADVRQADVSRLALRNTLTETVQLQLRLLLISTKLIVLAQVCGTEMVDVAGAQRIADRIVLAIVVVLRLGLSVHECFDVGHSGISSRTIMTFCSLAMSRSASASSWRRSRSVVFMKSFTRSARLKKA